MYKLNPTVVNVDSWWAPVCKLTCKNWPIMSESIGNNTTMDIYNDSCNQPRFNPTISTEPQFSYLLALFFGIPATLIIIITVFGNFLVLCFKAKVGKRQTTLLIWNLGLADFLVGVFVLPVGVSYVIGRKWPFSRLICRIWVSCDVIFCTASIVTLCIISVDRYIGVTRPLRYKLIVTKTKVIISIIAIWLFSICILLATIRYHSDTDYCFNPTICHPGNELEYVIHSVVFAFFLPTFITLFLYWKIYKVAKQREKGLAQGLILAMGQNFFKECFAIPLRIHCGKDAMSQQQQVIRMHKRVAKTLGVVVSAFVVCWCPFFSLYIIAYQCGSCIPSLLLDITSWLGYCNSMINPVIYAFTVDEFKHTLQLLLCSLWRGRAATQPTEQNRVPYEEGRRMSRPIYPPASTLPRSNRAYSLVPVPEEEGSLSRFSQFAKRRFSRVDESDNEGSETLLRERRRQGHGRRSKRVTMSMKERPRRRTAPELMKRGSLNDANVGLMMEEKREVEKEKTVKNGTAGSSMDRFDMEEGSDNDQPLWNAKLYCTLISPHSTGL